MKECRLNVVIVDVRAGENKTKATRADEQSRRTHCKAFSGSGLGLIAAAAKESIVGAVAKLLRKDMLESTAHDLQSTMNSRHSTKAVLHNQTTPASSVNPKHLATSQMSREWAPTTLSDDSRSDQVTAFFFPCAHPTSDIHPSPSVVETRNGVFVPSG